MVNLLAINVCIAFFYLMSTHSYAQTALDDYDFSITPAPAPSPGNSTRKSALQLCMELRATDPRRALAECEKASKSDPENAVLLELMAKINGKLGNLGEAERLLISAISLGRKHSEQAVVARCTLGLAQIKKRKGEILESMRLLESAKQMCERIPINECLAWSLVEISDIHLKRGYATLARPLLTNALTLFTEAQNKSGLARAYYVLRGLPNKIAISRSGANTVRNQRAYC